MNAPNGTCFTTSHSIMFFQNEKDNLIVLHGSVTTKAGKRIVHCWLEEKNTNIVYSQVYNFVNGKHELVKYFKQEYYNLYKPKVYFRFKNKLKLAKYLLLKKKLEQGQGHDALILYRKELSENTSL